MWAVSSSESIQKAPKYAVLESTIPVVSHLKSRVPFGRTDVIVHYVGVRL